MHAMEITMTILLYIWLSNAIKNRDGFTALELAKNQECGQNILAALTRCRIQYLPQCSVNAGPTDKSLYEEYTER